MGGRITGCPLLLFVGEAIFVGALEQLLQWCVSGGHRTTNLLHGPRLGGWPIWQVGEEGGWGGGRVQNVQSL